jgi:NitT/TauT family transport system ATP-binding protein
LDRVGVTYASKGRPGLLAVDDVSLEVRDNEFITIVGPSGCGKSTLLRLVAGLQMPSAGQVTVSGKRVVQPGGDIGMVFQKATLLDWRTAIENVLLPVEFLKLDYANYRARASSLLELLGLRDFKDHYPRALSGGMQQRVGIGRALISDPRILLMDEPFGALDALTREELSLELLRIWEERRKTVLFVTHSIPEAVLLANRVVVMTARPGRVAGVIEVPLPRPRTLAMEFSEEFRTASEAIRALVYTEHHPVPA